MRFRGEINDDGELGPEMEMSHNIGALVTIEIDRGLEVLASVLTL